MTATRARILRFLCMLISAGALVAAGAMMIVLEDKSNAIFAILVAALLARLLVLDLGGWLDRQVPTAEESTHSGRADG